MRVFNLVRLCNARARTRPRTHIDTLHRHKYTRIRSSCVPYEITRAYVRTISVRKYCINKKKKEFSFAFRVPRTNFPSPRSSRARAARRQSAYTDQCSVVSSVSVARVQLCVVPVHRTALQYFPSHRAVRVHYRLN